jgi:hypothetical protein
LEILGAGESAVAVMTSSHRSGLEKRLIAQSFEVNEAKDNGRLAIYDADQALSQFMDAAEPSRKRFLLQFGEIVRRALAAAVAKKRTGRYIRRNGCRVVGTGAIRSCHST